MKNECGYLYAAFGDKYIAEATMSAGSLKKLNDSLQTAIVSDQQVNEACFDHVIILPASQIENWKNGLTLKIESLNRTPFDKTIFIDTDTYFCESANELFELLRYFDLLICQDFWEASDITIENKIIPAYHALNTGMLAYCNNESFRLLLSQWRDDYAHNIQTLRHDQPALMSALIKTKFRFFILPSIYNFRYVQNLAIHVNETVKIIHGRASLEQFEWLQKKLNKSHSQRAWDAAKQKCFSHNDRYFWNIFKKPYGYLRKKLK